MKEKMKAVAVELLMFTAKTIIVAVAATLFGYAMFLAWRGFVSYPFFSYPF